MGIWGLNIALNTLGIAVFFTDRYWGRIDKNKKFDFKYWLKDNAQEMTTTLLLNTSLMLLLFQTVKTESVDVMLSKLPDWVTLLGIPGLCLGLGAGFSWTIYELFKSKRKDVEAKIPVEPVVVPVDNTIKK